MSATQHRRKLLECMEENSILVVYSGRQLLANEDEYLPFEVNSIFYYLTGSERENLILLMAKCGGRTVEKLFIEPVDEFSERWTGRMPRQDEMQALTGIEDVQYTTEFSGVMGMLLCRYPVQTAYFDTFRNQLEDLPTWNAAKALEFQKHYPDVHVKNLHTLTAALREVKDEDEITSVRRAVSITAKGLEAVLHYLKPGMKEYQIQAVFEGTCRYHGARNLAFPTIAAGGKNACSMHYDANQDELQDGELLLLDLGAKYGNYCSDISRTYPIGGSFSPLQRELYEVVLQANRAVAALAAPGVTFGQLEEKACEVLGNGLTELGFLDSPEEVRTYYMHSVSHSIGIDPHDVDIRNVPLQAGWIISDEPGVYIDGEAIGIRIEDDLLITETGCEVLSAAIPKDPDEIEQLMAEAAAERRK